MYTNLRLVHTQSRMIAGRLDIRIYASDHSDTEVRYHVGLPAELLPPSAWVFAETEPYMGERHWAEQDGHYLYWLSVISPAGAPIPFADIQRQLVWMQGQINKALAFLRSAGYTG